MRNTDAYMHSQVLVQKQNLDFKCCTKPKGECHYRQLMQVQHTLNRLDVFSEVIISSPHVSQTASFSLVLVKYRHTRLLLRKDVELLLLASCSEDNTLLLVAIFTTHGGFA